MIILRVSVLAWWALASTVHAADAVPDLASHVNPFLGTKPCPTGHSGFSFDTGDVFPGAVAVHGMVQFSPDTPRNQAGGYWYPDTAIKSFSLTHFSGRGIPYEGDFGFMPIAGGLSASSTFDFGTYKAPFSHANEEAHPGYYKVTLDNGHVVELTATPRTGMMQVTFPAGATAGTILLNIGNNVRGVSAGEVTVVDGHEITGFATSPISSRQLYTVYLSVIFDRPITATGTWTGPALTPGAAEARGGNVGAYVSFDTSTNKVVHAIAGISYISIENARLNRTTENPGSFFADVARTTREGWNTALGSVKITDPDASSDSLAVFYTELYHTLIHPNLFDDVNGQYLGFDDVVHTVAKGHHHYTHIPGWDEYRSHTPLIAFLFPGFCSDVAQSLVDDAAQNKGIVPRWVQQNRDSRGMIGDGGSIILANAYAFGARDFDARAALADVEKNGTGANKYLEAEEQFRTNGWVPDKGSVTLEYCVAHMANALFAKSLGDTASYETNAKLAQNWRYIFNSTTLSLTPRTKSGDWDILGAGWIEGTQEQYAWLVPFNLSGLFDAMGGNDKVVPRLDAYFGWNPDKGRYEKLNYMKGPNDFAGNEPDETQPWSYLYAGAPWKTQKVLRDIQTQLYFNAPDGLPGNDDAGALSSWYVFSVLGIYPMIPGEGGFVIGSPLFAHATLTTDSGHVLQIDGVHAAPGNPYVQSLQVNGQPSTSLWLPVRTILDHPLTTLTFTLGDKPDTSWATAATDAPPSFNGVDAP